MSGKLSLRLSEIIDALPIYPGIRILEIGCGPGMAAREIANRVGSGHILAIDRSSKAIRQAMKRSEQELKRGHLSFRQISIEDFELEKGEAPFDIAFAVRVGALDGRHPKAGVLALQKISSVLTENGKLFIDGGIPLKEISLEDFRK